MSDDVTRFITDLTRQERAVKTVANYRSDLVLFQRWVATPLGQAFSAAAVTPTDIRDYKGYLQVSAGAKPATINRRLAALRAFFAWAKAAKLITELPTESVKGVASVPTAPKALEKREVDRLIRTAERDGDKRNLAILQTLRHAGIRVGELCALRLGDVAISERKGTLTVRSGKGSKYREMPLNADARKAIAAYLAVRPTVDDDRLFIGQRRDGIKVQAVENVVTKYARLAGLPEVTCHTLRHSFGKNLVDAGVNLVTVAKLLGHERIQTTAVYTQPNARDLERAVAQLTGERTDR